MERIATVTVSKHGLESVEMILMCSDLLDSLPSVPAIDYMSKTDLCRFCNVERLAMMQRSPYSVYDEFWKSQLEYVYLQCGSPGPTAIPPSVVDDSPKPEAFCISDTTYTTTKTETCDSIALQRSVSSAALFMANQPAITNCSTIYAGTKLCLPLSCQKTYTVKSTDDCFGIEQNNYDPSSGLGIGEMVQTYNPWVSYGCDNLQGSTSAYGHVICLSPQNGVFNSTDIDPKAIPKSADGRTWTATSPPSGAKVATGTTTDCGKWYKASADDSCTSICLAQKITSELFLGANPSLGTGMDGCDAALKTNSTCCTGPTYSWKGAGS
jgi:hypothetical protein